MQGLYFALAAVNLVIVAGTATLWVLTDRLPEYGLKHSVKEIRASHWGASFNASLFLTLAYAFERVGTPIWFQAVFPAGLVTIFSLGMVYNLAPILKRETGPRTRPAWMGSWVGLLGPLSLLYLIASLIGAALALAWPVVPRH